VEVAGSKFGNRNFVEDRWLVGAAEGHNFVVEGTLVVEEGKLVEGKVGYNQQWQGLVGLVDNRYAQP